MSSDQYRDAQGQLVSGHDEEVEAQGRLMNGFDYELQVWVLGGEVTVHGHSRQAT